MAGVSLHSRDRPYLRLPGGIRALVLQTMGWRLRISMKKEETRRAVLSEYDGWAKEHPNAANMMGGFLFFRYLQQERSDLLDFRAAGSKWQIVHGWLQHQLKDYPQSRTARSCSILSFTRGGQNSRAACELNPLANLQ